MAIAHEGNEVYWTNPGSNILQNSSCMATCLPSLKPFKSDKQDMQVTGGEVGVSSKVTFSGEPHYTEEQVLDDQLELIYNSSVWTRRREALKRVQRYQHLYLILVFDNGHSIVFNFKKSCKSIKICWKETMV